ncbi:zinc finger protein 518A-like [Myxocyprinus asiaticus]|uniref:zinc finger protein 518A-like n=1 Tax=Myxocyprinus asiaticus TaxID=70543 RepID=UPI0022219180|nr:zinc finger protein 518A-like [Myxocyprinus asiaticus]XP_051531065.1 zinc finger protein 518A-like [Myxocyprinus asiaticus]
MEVDLTSSDDPPKSHDQGQDDDTSLDHLTLPLELAHQLSETASCNENCDQDEAPPEESGTDNLNTHGKASGKSPCKTLQGAIFSGKILSFCCSECKDDTTYSPNDLLKHFQGVHKGTLPTYPCDLCSFVTNEFSALQRHRIGHRNTLVTCEICNDGVQYSLLLLTRHFTACHSHNGHFRCKKCEFSTRDAGTFVQHIHHHNELNQKCVKCPLVSPTQGELQRHNLVHSGIFPFSCQICGYSAARREYLNKHLTVAHSEEVDRTIKRKAIEDNTGVNSPGLKLLLKKSPPVGGSREMQWMSKLNSLPAVGLLDHNGRLFNPEKTLEETQHFLERAVGVKKESNKWTKSPLKTEPQCLHPIPATAPQPKLQEHELSPGSGLLNPTNSNGLTVLMVKNKISIPPNCTTKVMGFKMVDGKKHLVLKVIPTKQEDSTDNEVSDSHSGEDEDKISSPCSSFSPSVGSLLSLESGESNETDVKNYVKSSIKEKSKEVENHIGNQPPLIEEHAVSFERAWKIGQVYNEDTENTDKVNLSASHNVDIPSSTLQNSSPSQCQSSQSNGRSSPNEISLLCERSSNEDIKPANPSVTLSISSSELSSAISETTLSESPMAEIESSKDQMTVLSSVIDGLPVSQLAADGTTCSDALSHAKSNPEMTVVDTSQSANILQSKLPSKTIAEESLIQKATLENNKCFRNVFSLDCKPCETKSGQSPPTESHVVSDSVAEKENDSDKFETLSETTAIKALSSKTVFEESSQFLPNVSCAPNTSKTSYSDSVVVNCNSPKITTNENTESNSSLQNKISTGESTDVKEYCAEVENNSLSSLSQKVFSFHNYSKDTSGSSPDSLQPEEDPTEGMEEEECEEDFGDWSLTLPASPPFPAEQSEEDLKGNKQTGANEDSGENALERVSDSDIEVDECIATVDDSVVPVLPDSMQETACSSLSEKKQDDRAPASLKNATVLGKILEKHSDAIISQQLEKERMKSLTTVQEPVRPTRTTLRILQTPEGKQQMFLQTAETPYGVPVQLKSGAGFKLITKSCSPKINVSYVKPGIETNSKTTGLALTLNGGRIGMSAQSSNEESKGQATVQMAPSGSGNRYFVNAAALKGSLLLSSAVKSSSGEQATDMPQTCYLVQRPVSVTQVSSESIGASSKPVLATRPVLAMPVSTADKTSPLQTGRQAYLVRYIAPAKSGILLNNSNGKASNQGNQVNDGGKNRVFLKVLRGPNGTRFLSSAPYTTTSAKKPLYLATSSLQSPCFLMSSSKSLSNVSAGLKTSVSSQGLAHKLIPAQLILPQSNVQIKNRGDPDVALQKSPLVPCLTRPLSQRKRRRKALFEEMQESSSKTRRISSNTSAKKDATSVWEPFAKDVERRLRLCPFSPLQEIKCPRRNQPVVVLNHPDADIPEVASIMRSVNKYRGEVFKVVLSQSTVKTLSELSLTDPSNTLSKQKASNSSGSATSRPVGVTVQERFILKLKLKKTSRNKYEVVRSSSAGFEQQSRFCCWFCGRLFNNQEDWIGHGQRHLMEATKDWNKLF